MIKRVVRSEALTQSEKVRETIEIQVFDKSLDLITWVLLFAAAQSLDRAIVGTIFTGHSVGPRVGYMVIVVATSSALLAAAKGLQERLHSACRG